MKSFITIGLSLGLIIFANSKQAEAQSKIRDDNRIIRPPPFFPIPPRELPIFVSPTIKIPVNETPVELQKIDIQVRINGLETETTTTMTFRNPNGRVLEGNLEFPLPSDASVSGYALDVNGTLIDGVIVPKEKARVVLETEMRKGVDPGILEHVAGNFFRTRIYPIPAMGTRTIRIVSVAPLSLVKGDAAMHIPLPRNVTVAQMSLEVKVSKGAKKPEIGGFGNLTFSEWDKEWVAKAKLSNVTADNDLFVNLPKLSDQVVGIEQFEDEYYASISDAPKKNTKIETAAPQKIKIAWDASGSRDQASVKKDREFLVGLFKEWKNLTVDLFVFRNQVEPAVTFQVKNGQASDLFPHLDKLPYDGGTNISALNLKKGNSENTEPWLLFTDGFETIKEEIPEIGNVPVHVISSSTSRNINLLRFLSEASGGVFIDIATLDNATAVQTLVKPALTLLRVENPAGDVDDVQSRFQPGSGRANVYAKFKKETTLQLVYGHNGKELFRNSIRLKKSDVVKGQLIARAWAASRAMELAVFAEKNEKELVNLGRKYNLVTPGTSLIVLERVDQYLTYEIVPPHNMPQWREQYFASLKGQQQNKMHQEKNKIEMVLSWWKNRVEWWERKYNYSKDFVYVGNEMKEGSSKGSSIGYTFALGNDMAESAPAALGSQALSNRAGKSSPQAFGSGAMMDFSVPTDSGAPRRKEKDSADNDSSQAAVISIKEWSPTTPYLTEIKSKQPKQAYTTYMVQRASYASSPAFFLDCANYFFKNDRLIALRILSNLAELKLDDPALLRTYAWRMQEAGELDGAIDVLTKVRKLRPEEPQSHRDLALMLSMRLDRDKNTADGVKAVELLNQVILGSWDRFAEVEVIALMELNRVLTALERIDKKSLKKVSFVDERLRKALDLDVRITMSWDADATDMDLHITEPSNEEAFYAHQNTTIGGLVSRDFTQGYGPEEYIIRKAMPGVYKIRAKYFGSRQQTLLGPVTVTATVITHFGRPNEKRQALTLRLSDAKDMVDIGEITFGMGEKGKDGTIANSTLTKNIIKLLKKGMEPEAVVKALGTPERKEGGALTVLLYRLSDGKQIRVGLGPNLLWVKEIHDGAEVEIGL